MAVSVRRRFEIFKRDDFACRYCGRKSPEVVLEVDHITPVCNGGTDDEVNLVTSCWACNRGKSGVPLSELITAEDPHDRAVLLLERERQLSEYNNVLAVIYARKNQQAGDLLDYWTSDPPRGWYSHADDTWVRNALDVYPTETIREAMRLAKSYDKVEGLGYVNGCLKRWQHKRPL